MFPEKKKYFYRRPNIQIRAENKISKKEIQSKIYALKINGFLAEFNIFLLA